MQSKTKTIQISLPNVPKIRDSFTTRICLLNNTSPTTMRSHFKSPSNTKGRKAYLSSIWTTTVPQTGNKSSLYLPCLATMNQSNPGNITEGQTRSKNLRIHPMERSSQFKSPRVFLSCSHWLPSIPLQKRMTRVLRTISKRTSLSPTISL